MAKSVDRFQPTLFEFPIQNARTGWHPVWTPTILVVPWSLDVNGARIAHSQVQSVTFAIERIIQINVAGHPQSYDPLGPKPEAAPDRIIFQITLTHNELLQYQIDLNDVIFYNDDGVTETPEESDEFEFVNARGIVGHVEYLPDAEYFDLSSVEIAVDNLPSDRYVASWTVNYFERIRADEVLFCINSERELTDKLDYFINHPGEIHEEMVKRTPAVYMEDIDKKEDFTVQLYRPFADILQDVFDESELFYGINWIKKIPPQLFPYLSYLIGIELPTQSGAQNLDTIRRRMLERGTELQKLKGSELAIKELFSILGFVIEIVHLWVNVDGSRFIAPNEPDPEPRIAPREEITSTPVSQTDPLLANYTESGFGDVEIPLLYHNNDNHIVLNAYIVQNGSDAQKQLQDIIDNVIIDSEYLTKNTIINAPDGYMMLPPELVIDSDGVEAYSRLVVSDIEVLSESHSGLPIIRFEGIDYNILRDLINVTFANYKNFDKSTLYVFATYEREEVEVPGFLKDNLTNRFDIKIISKAGDIESSLYDYLIDSLFKFKAFHSLLRKISYDIPLRDFYNVTDFCANSFLSQQSDADANALMIPPACPTTECFVTDACNDKNARGGLRESDEEFSDIILSGLKEEYDAWHAVTEKWLDISEEHRAQIEWAKSVSNIDVPVPNNVGDSFGQDRVSYDFIVETTGSELMAGTVLDMIYQGTYLESSAATGIEPIILTIIPTKNQVLSDITNIRVDVEIIRQFSVTKYYVSMGFDVDNQNDPRSKIIELDRLSTPDYCYKGRPRDFLLLQTLIQPKTIVRNRPCGLMAGTGVYYGLEHGELENVRGWYHDNLQRTDQDLHFSNRLFFEDLYMGSDLRPSINIEKHGFAFPGHRPIRGGLLDDFLHPDYAARPWDIADNCFELINPLNAQIIEIEEIDGTVNEQLIYDKSALTYVADNIAPDIPNYSGSSVTAMTHSTYTTAEERSYVTLDNTVHTTETEVLTDSPIFETAAQCGTDTHTDYIDGYPASTGDLSFEAEEVWSERLVDSGIFIEPDIPSGSFTAAATFSSEVPVEEPLETETLKTYNQYDLWKGFRFDCGCLEYPCGDEERTCNYTFFKNIRGEYDFNNDHLEIDYAASLIERIATDDYKYNGEITDCLNWEFDDTSPKELEYRDEYGIYYKIFYETNGEVFDIQYETFQPRVWGEEPSGFMENNKVFRKGILTTIRQVYKLENGNWVLSAEGTEQEVVHRQTNYDCDMPQLEDKTTHYHEYVIQEEPQMLVSCGPHWTDPADETDVFSVWGELDPTASTAGTEGCAVSAFEFVDVWESYETTKIFIPGVGVVDQAL